MRPFSFFMLICALRFCTTDGGYTMAHADDPPEKKHRDDPAPSDPHVFFFEDFEHEDYAAHFNEATHPQNRALVSGDAAFDGHHSLRFTVRGGDHYGGSLSFVFSRAGMPEPEELYARYYLRLGPAWDPGRGGKLPGPSGTYDRAGWGGRKVNGTDGWSAPHDMDIYLDNVALSTHPIGPAR